MKQRGKSRDQGQKDSATIGPEASEYSREDRLFRNEDLLLGHLSGRFGPTRHTSPFKLAIGSGCSMSVDHRNNLSAAALRLEIANSHGLLLIVCSTMSH